MENIDAMKKYPVQVNGAVHHLTLDQIEQLRIDLSKILSASPDTDPAVTLVSDKLGISVAHIMSNERTEDLVIARWCIMALLRNRCTSLKAIGRVLGMDRRSVNYGLRAIRERANVNPHIRAALEKVEAA